MSKLQKLINMRGEMVTYREVRNFLKNVAQHQLGWAELKRNVGFKNYRRRFFNISDIVTDTILLIPKGETEKYIYFDIISDRAFKRNPQIKVSRDLIKDPEDFTLGSLNDCTPLNVVVQKELCIRHTKAMCRTQPRYFICDTLQICIRRQDIPYMPDKALKLYLALKDEKGTHAGSSRYFSTKTSDPLFIHRWSNKSYAGTHWEKGILIIQKKDIPIKCSYVFIGASGNASAQEWEV